MQFQNSASGMLMDYTSTQPSSAYTGYGFYYNLTTNGFGNGIKDFILDLDLTRGTLSAGVGDKVVFWYDTGTQLKQVAIELYDNPGSPDNKCNYFANSSNKMHLSVSSQELRAHCTGFGDSFDNNPDYKFVAMYYVFTASGTTERYTYMTNFTLYNGTNSLPTFTFNISSLACYNDSKVFQYVPIDLSFDVNDTEGDDIYYAVSSQTENTITAGTFDYQNTVVTQCKHPDTSFHSGVVILDLLISFANNFWLDCQQVPITATSLSFNTPQFTTIGDSCKVLDNGTYSDFYVTGFTNYENKSVGMLVLNAFCLRYPEAYLDLKSNLGYLTDFSFENRMYMNSGVNNTFNLTFYSDVNSHDITAQFKFVNNATSGLVDLYRFNSTSQVYIGQMVLPVFGVRNVYDIGIWYNNSNGKMTFSYLNSTGKQQNFTNVDSYDGLSKVTRFVGYSVVQGGYFVYLERYQFGGDILTPEFSTSIPTQLTLIRGTGVVDVTVYVTDDKHLATGEFNYDTEYINLNQCTGYGTGYVQDSPQNSNPDVLDLLGITKYFLGDIARDSLIGIGLYGKAKYMIWLFYLFFIFVAIIGEYAITHTITLAPVLTGFSLLFLVISFLLSMWVNVICFTILFAFGLSPVFSSHVNNGNRGS